MRKLILFLISLLVFFTGAAWASSNELKIFIWSEYMDEKNMPKDFEKETGIKVKIDLFESNEDMVAKLQAGGVNQYDIIVPSDYMIPSLINLKLVQPLDHLKIPNIGNLGKMFRESIYDTGNKYSVGWQWGTVGLLYDKTKLSSKDVSSWSILFDPKKNPGQFALIDSVREMMGISLLYLGYNFNSVNPKELLKASELLIKTKKRANCIGFKGGVGGKNDVVAGTASAAIVYNGDALRAVAEYPKRLAFIVPKEGGEIWLDSMCIPAKAPNLNAAHKWINWILTPKVGAALSNYNHYASPNDAVKPYLNKEDFSNTGIWPTPETMKKLVFSKDLGKDTKVLDEAWTRVKSH